jgi:carbon-monoxide dehydrogenase large subunit
VKFTGRREDDRLLTGRGGYTADWNLPGQLYGAFLRSDRAHAEILSLKKPEQGLVLTGEDTKDLKDPPPLVAIPGAAARRSRSRTGTSSRAAACATWGRKWRSAVADSPQAAQDLAEQIEVEYRELPVVVDAEEALAPGAPLLHEGIPGNLCFDYEYGSEQAAEDALAAAAHVTRLTLDSTRVSGTPMEPKACVASWDAASGSFDLYAASQGKGMMVPSLGAILGVPAEKIRLHALDVGGGFGIRSDAYPEYVAPDGRARQLGRPVKWVGSPLRDHRQRLPRARREAGGRARPRPRRPLRRAAGELDGERRRPPVAARAADQHAQSLDARRSTPTG